MAELSTTLRDRAGAPAVVRLPDDRGGVTWRPMTKADLEAVCELQRTTGLVDHPGWVMSLGELTEEFGSEGLVAERDTAVALAEGRIVAYGFSREIAGGETVMRTSIDGVVDLDWRRRGIGTALLAWQEANARWLLARHDDPVPGWITTGAAEQSTSMIALFEQHGYDRARWWLELERDLTAVAAEPALVEPRPARGADASADDAGADDAGAGDLRIVTYGAEWSELTRQARNTVFEDHWGSQPTTAADWQAHRRGGHSRDDLSLVAVAPDARGVDEVVAFVLSEVNEGEWSARGHSFGYIGYVGVRREYRGRRLAQALISRVMRSYRSESLAAAVLDVDADSPTGAVGLYEGLGFAPVNRSLSLVKTL